MSADPQELKPEEIKVFYDQDDIKSIFRDALTVADKVSEEVELEGSDVEFIRIPRADLKKLVAGLSVALKLVRKPNAKIPMISSLRQGLERRDDHWRNDPASDLFDFSYDPPKSEGGD